MKSKVTIIAHCFERRDLIIFATEHYFLKLCLYNEHFV